jgi:lipopolysaccharide export LptBFGC system permease protein LptF
LIKTLGLFLSRELAKVTGMALVAFTLVMTIFAIIEPLRKEGLAAGQLASLLAYTVPMMLSLTLPIAALFASTIVYGRFSQDNELTACRASGISTVRLLKPAMALGAVVTVCSLVLSNYVTPKMVKLTEYSVKANMLGIVRQKFRSQSYVDYGQQIVHADGVEQDGETLDLRGVVAVDGHRRDDIRVLTASNAVVRFDQSGGQTYVTICLMRHTVMRTNSRDIIEQASMPLSPYPLPGPAREDATWYEWDRLLRTLKEPVGNSEIAAQLTRIQRRIANDTLAHEIAETINRGLAYDGLSLEGETYSIRSASAETEDKDRDLVALRSATREGQPGRPVEVSIRQGGKVRQVVKAENGSIEMTWSLGQDAPVATVTLRDGVTVTGGADGGLQRRTNWETSQLSVPQEVVRLAATIRLEDICLRGSELTSSPGIRREIKNLNGNSIPRLTNRIISELHGRIAYGVSCFLMVAMGAALGLMFRGGQIISAFALAVMPAAIVIVMMLMGKQLVRRIDLPTFYGLAAIWGGIVALLAADACVYLHLARK